MTQDVTDKNHLAKALLEADEWTRQYGIMTNYTHDSIIVNTHANFPKVKYIEYMVDPEEQKMDLIVYLGFWTLFFMFIFRRHKKFIDAITDFVSEYIHTYSIQTYVKRHTGQGKL